MKLSKTRSVKTLPPTKGPKKVKIQDGKVKKQKENKISDEKIKKIVSVTPKLPPTPLKKKYVVPSKSVKKDLVNKCLEALMKLFEHTKKSNRMFEDEAPIYAEINCIKIQNTQGNVKFVLPHSTVFSTGEVCLITPDMKKGKKVDHEPTVDHWEDLLREAGVTSVKTVLPLRQLRVEYDQFELKRRLLTQHDIIMVDTRVLSHASHVLGKKFFKKHNMLIPVRLHEKKNIKDAIDTGLRTAMLRLNIGVSSSVIIGHTGMPQEKLAENILSLVNQLQDRYPGGQMNVRAINLKLLKCTPLPLYLTLRPSNSVHPPKMTQKRPKNYMVLEDELSTMPGSRIQVAPDGTVVLKKGDADEDDSEMEEDPEEEDGKEDSDNEQSE